ncbi:YjbE family putative metal transport protein [Effusibacillus dendaii]|uniref:Integral membrane protein n=1 Tax=Effusibacillus dendaii TaxID=2743772 RepID=A0A7I8D7F2_9BACL|nr:YjbE family putative metal transport protein [Effusibacillus dendaii]BCJ86093.1 integral membrane protein [Effusibacillus dendaii]
MDKFWLEVGELVVVNFVLSGDNALLIAMATANLPPYQRRLAMTVGIIGAMVLRILLTAVAAELMSVPLVKTVGALLLILIAATLTGGEESDKQTASGTTFWSGVSMVLLADVTMSLDNVAALAGMTDGNFTLLLTGLAISMVLMLVASAGISTILEQFPQFIWLGAGLLALTAGQILAKDTALLKWTGGSSYPILIGIGLLICAIAWQKWRKGQPDM